MEALLFAVWKVPQASMGFSPFELLDKWKPCGVLDVNLKKIGRMVQNEIQYILDL